MTPRFRIIAIASLSVLILGGLALTALTRRQAPSTTGGGTPVEVVGTAFDEILASSHVLIGLNNTGSRRITPSPTNSVLTSDTTTLANALSPDGLHLARLASNSGKPAQWHILDVTTGSQVGLIDTAANALAWSPDGTRVAYGFSTGSGYNLSTSDPTGTQWQAIASVPAPFEQLWWLPIQTYVAGILANDASSLVQIGLSGKQVKTILDGAAELSSSPDGTHLLVLKQTRLSNDQALLLATAGSDGIATPSPISLPATTLDDVVWSTDGQRVFVLKRAAVNTIAEYDLTGKQLRVVATSTATASLANPSRLLLVDANNLYYESGRSIFRFTLGQ